MYTSTVEDVGTTNGGSIAGVTGTGPTSLVSGVVLVVVATLLGGDESVVAPSLLSAVRK